MIHTIQIRNRKVKTIQWDTETGLVTINGKELKSTYPAVYYKGSMVAVHRLLYKKFIDKDFPLNKTEEDNRVLYVRGLFKPENLKVLPPTLDKLIELYNTCSSAAEAGRMMDTTGPCIERALKKHGLPSFKEKRKYYVKKKEKYSRVREFGNMAELGKYLGISKVAVFYSLQTGNVARTTGVPREIWCEETKLELVG